MASMHPFARSPTPSRSTGLASSIPSPPVVPDVFSSTIGTTDQDIKETALLREFQESRHRTSSLGQLDDVTDRGHNRGAFPHTTRVYKKVTRSPPPPSGPPAIDLPPVPSPSARLQHSNKSESSNDPFKGSKRNVAVPYSPTKPPGGNYSPRTNTSTSDTRIESNLNEPIASSSRHNGNSSTEGSLSRSISRRTRVPSKDLLQSALDLAQKAVECDKENDVQGALLKYREAVGRLRCVMERVGIELGPIPPGLGLPEPTEAEKEDSAQARRRRAASGHRNGDEGKVLKGIHDAYISRIGLLCQMEKGTMEPDGLSTGAQTVAGSESDTGAIGGEPTLTSPFVQDGPIQSEAPTRAPLQVVTSQNMTGSNPSYTTSEAPIDVDATPRKGSSSPQEVTLPIKTTTASALISGSSAAASPTNTTGSAGSKRQSLRSRVRQDSMRSLGLESELQEQDSREVLEQQLEGMSDEASAGLPLENPISSHSRQSSMAFSNGFGAFDQSEPAETRVDYPVSGSANRHHSKNRSMPSVMEEGSAAPDMTQSQGRISRRTASLSRPRDSMAVDGDTSPSKQASFFSPGVTGSDSYQGTPRTRAVSQPNNLSASVNQYFDASLAPPLPIQSRAIIGPEPHKVPNIAKSLTIDTAVTAPETNYAASNVSESTVTVMPNDLEEQEAVIDGDISSQSLTVVRAPPMPSPAAEAPPIHPILVPFHLLRLIRNTIISPSGGFLSKRLHIPKAIWSQTTVKLVSLDTKVRAIEVLLVCCSSLSRNGEALLSNDVVERGAPVGGLSRTRAEILSCAKEFMKVLDETEGVLDDTEKLLNKKMGLKGHSNSIKGKKMSTSGISVFGSKLTKTFDRIATGKSVDSPTEYIDSLSRLGLDAQVIESHLKCFAIQQTVAYTELKPETRAHIDMKLRRLSNFISNFVLTFVMQDIGFLLAKYLKQSSKWLED